MGSPSLGRSAVVLLSGGLDSSTVLHVALRDGYQIHALSFDYGQRHTCELDAARAVAARAGVQSHRVLRLDPAAFAGSALTDPAIPVPRQRSDEAIGHGIPITYVPARNTVFLALALAVAETLGARDLFLGVNVLDASGYPDCRAEFVHAFENVANLGTRAAAGGQPYRIHAPLVTLSKAEIVRLGSSLGVDFALTRSCYDPDGAGGACGGCDACRLRARGFREAGLPDPTVYAGGLR